MRHVVSFAGRRSEFSVTDLWMEKQVRDPEKQNALERMTEAAGLLEAMSGVPARLVLSFFVPGDDRPPTILLNEFTMFFNDRDPTSHSYDLMFRTDVTECWHARAKYPPPSVLDAARLLRGCELQRGHDLRYGVGSLPFDPEVSLRTVRLTEDGTLLSHTVTAVIRFEQGEDQIPIDRALPDLLKLREDDRRAPLF